MFTQEQLNVLVRCVERGAPVYADEIKQEIINVITEYNEMYKRLQELAEEPVTETVEVEEEKKKQ